MSKDDDYFRKQPHPDDDFDLHREIQDDEHLAEDYDTPFSEPVDADDDIPDQHSLLDDRSDMDTQEIYDEGEDDAAVDSLGTNIRTNNPTVLGYDPDKDERRNNR